MPRDRVRSRRLGVLAPAALSACMDASVLAVPAAGAIVSTVLQELSKAFMLKKWFHGMMSTKEAESLMMEKGKNGSFLVRESLARPGEFVLTVRARGRVSHVMIKRQHNKYEVGSGEQFEDLVGLIEHFRSFPMVENSGTVLRLLQPISGTALKMHDLQQKVEEIQNVTNIQNDKGSYFLDKEFMLLRIIEKQNIFTTIEGEKIENINKNRYKNILPYDQTRVILRDRLHGGDYINANYIRPLLGDANSVQSSNESLDSTKAAQNTDCCEVKQFKKYLSCDELRNLEEKPDSKIFLHRQTVTDKFYIATQGCLPNTVDDFWHMVWQEDIRIIVMITQESERGKSKCERYWPSLGACECRAYNISVRLTEELFRPHCTLRKLQVSDHKGNSNMVYHYQFTAWPDHGIPQDAQRLLQFIEDINTTLIMISNSIDAPHQNILCVHCSAGVGRTGTFIALDMLIDSINSSGGRCNLDVHNTVKLIRSQRNGMVQNKMQYKFIYIALKEYICSTYKK